VAATDPRITDELRREFEACQALLDFGLENRPSETPKGDAQADLVLATYARSSKTYQGLLRLAHVGYGDQALMLGRSLFEDMLIAHWIVKNTNAPGKLERYRRYTVVRLREAAHKYHRDDYLAQLPDTESRTQRDELKNEFAGSHNWTGFTLDALVSELEAEWGGEGDRKLLWETYAFSVGNANQVLHHSHLGVASTRVERTPVLTKFNIGGSPKFVRDALFVAFFSYVNTMSLVLDGEPSDALTLLCESHLMTFVTIAEAESGLGNDS
jgi:hypothetical protein